MHRQSIVECFTASAWAPPQRIESARFCSCCLKDPTPARLIAPLPAAEFPERPGHFRTQVPAGVTEGQTVEVQVPPGALLRVHLVKLIWQVR